MNHVSIVKSMPRGWFACCSAHFFSSKPKNSPIKPPEPSVKHLLDPLRTRLTVSVYLPALCADTWECLFLDKCLNVCTCLCACSKCCFCVWTAEGFSASPVTISAPLACWLTCLRGGSVLAHMVWVSGAVRMNPPLVQVIYRVCKQYRTVIWPWRPSLSSGWCLYWLLAWIGERMRSGVGSVHAEGTCSIKAMSSYDWRPTISHLIITPTRVFGYAILVLEKM